MPVVIPDPLAERFTELAHRKGYPSPTEYIADLVDDESDDCLEASCDEIDSLLLESLGGGPSIPDSPELRQRFRDRANGVL